MQTAHRDVVASIARDAARAGQPIEDALAAHVAELAPLIGDGVTALEIVAAAEQDAADMERWIAEYRRTKMAV